MGIKIAVYVSFLLTIGAASESGSRFDCGRYLNPSFAYETMCTDSIPHPSRSNSFVYTFGPCDSSNPVLPSVVFLPGMGALDPRVDIKLIEYLVLSGFRVLYLPNQPVSSVRNPESMVASALECMSMVFSKPHTGFSPDTLIILGHSLGGGMVPAVMYRAVGNRGWGTDRAAMIISAPWYAYGISEEQLAQFPPDVDLLTLTYALDRVNDHRIAVFLHTRISVPPNRKRYRELRVSSAYSGAIESYHSIMSTETGTGGNDDTGVECCGVYPVISSFMEHVLKGKRTPHTSEWNSTGACREIVSFDSIPSVRYPQARYVNFWAHRMNPLFEFRSNTKMRRPFFFRRRVTLRNYLKNFVMDRRSSRYGVLSDSIVSVAYPHPSWGVGRSKVVLNPSNDEKRPVLFFIDGRFDRWKDEMGIPHALADSGFVCVVPTDRTPLRILISKTKRTHVLLRGIDDLCDMLGQRVDTARFGIVLKDVSPRMTSDIYAFLSANRKWGGAGTFVYVIDDDNFGRKSPIVALNIPVVVDNIDRSLFSSGVRVRRVVSKQGDDLGVSSMTKGRMSVLSDNTSEKAVVVREHVRETILHLTNTFAPR